MTEAENEKGETKHDQGNLKNRQEKANKRKIFFPLLTKFPRVVSLILYKVSGRKKGYLIGIGNAILGILLQGK